MKTIAPVALLTLLFFFGCTKYDKPGYMPRPGVALTFDDCYIDEWYDLLPQFDSFHVKATFYISNYQNLTHDQKDKLRILKNHGHEIAYHTLSHPDMVKYLRKNSMEKLENEEIIRGLALMNADGFYPKNFAYPYGSHNEVLDNCLLRRFRSIRSLNGSSDFAKSYTSYEDNSKLFAIGMDRSSGKSLNDLLNLINIAQKNDNCLVLVGHHITRADKNMYVSPERLRKIIQAVINNNMKFYTVCEITR
ncbi:MAG TPA: polysaccharide deacetylase family protein [Flavisolibacter sp.]|nr:polysaccharide deacetylase family protein [Flavisolibacter sp.]